MKFVLLCLAGIATVILTISAEPEDGMVSLLVAGMMSGAGIYLFRRYTEDKSFITQIFLWALFARLGFGLVLHAFDLRGFTGPDAFAYDSIGVALSDHWMGRWDGDPYKLAAYTSIRGPGWGMNYLVGIIYVIAGQSILVAQTVCAVVGAAVAPMVFFCTRSIYNNRRAAITAATIAAFFPAFIIWSSQLLKDGLIVFLLVASVTLVIQLQRRFSWLALTFLILSLMGILSLRFYTFYVLVIAIVGGFVVGIETSMRSALKRIAVLGLVAVGLIYFGAVKIATSDIKDYGSLERIQLSRTDLANQSSGYGSDIDVSTSGGALSALPIGFAYLMFAPFPWEFKNLRQSLTLPDVLLWWAMLPLLVYGLYYAVRHRLRPNIPPLLFSGILTLAYSMFQGNLGAAYRQRTQIQVFLFMFIAVGWSLIRERAEDRRLVEANRKRQLAQQLRSRFQQAHNV